MSEYHVRAARCSHQADASTIESKIQALTQPLKKSWERIGRAKKILVKTNMIWPSDKIAYFEGRRRELVDDAVMLAVLKLIRSRTDAELCVIDTTFHRPSAEPGSELNFAPLLDETGVRFVDANQPPLISIDVPGGGHMFGRYLLHQEIADADEMISIAKMKNHAFMGVTLSTKNLFGLPPMPPFGRVRTYFHHIIRLPYVLADLARIMNPCLNIIDGLVGQAGREWAGEGRVADVLLAGDHPISTDACAAWLMGHDPGSDWPVPPFRRDRNHILVAAESGFGTVDLNQIDFQSDIDPPVAQFDTEEVDSEETVRSWRISTCEQALFYQEHFDELVQEYRGNFIFLQDGEVVWHGDDPSNLGSRRQLSGSKKHSALWLKIVDPLEHEGEHFDVYKNNLRNNTQSS